MENKKMLHGVRKDFEEVILHYSLYATLLFQSVTMLPPTF